jgi:hypothetical protein
MCVNDRIYRARRAYEAHRADEKLARAAHISSENGTDGQMNWH